MVYKIKVGSSLIISVKCTFRSSTAQNTRIIDIDKNDTERDVGIIHLITIQKIIDFSKNVSFYNLAVSQGSQSIQ